MKQCEYCGKELESYHLMYCKDSDCEERASDFYERRRNTEGFFGVVNIGCILVIMAGLIAAVFVPVTGNIVVACALALLGIVILILPYAPESFYKKWRIKKTTVIVRIFGIACMVGSLVFALLAVYYSNK